MLPLPLLLSMLLSLLFFSVNGQQYYLVAGTYTTTGSKGIYVYSFDADSGKLVLVSTTEGVGLVNPSFLTISPDEKFVYACTDAKLPTEGSVSAFAFDKTTGSLKFINKQQSGGSNPVYVAVHKGGKFLTVANYNSGTVSVFPINADGSLQSYTQLLRFTGSSINKERQEGPHAHATVFSPDGNHLLVSDLGTDKIMMYKVDENAPEPLTPMDPPSVIFTTGSGPRHMVFRQKGSNVYVVGEMGGSVSAYGYHSGRMWTTQYIPAHRKKRKPLYAASDIHLSPDERFLYVSNRGNENNIAIFSVSDGGFLGSVDYESTKGETPRNFTIDPTGKFLLVANQITGNIVVFGINNKTGKLKPTGTSVQLPQPSCLQMIKR